MERAFYGWDLLFCCLEKASRTKYGTSQRRERKQTTEPMAGVMPGWPTALALSLHPAVGLGPGLWLTATPAAVALLVLLGRRACGKSGLFLGSEKHLEIVCWNISLMFHIFIIQNCLGSLLGLVNSLRTFSSTMCRNCGSRSNAYTSAVPTGAAVLPHSTSIGKQLSLRGECSHGLEETLGGEDRERKKWPVLMESLLCASHFALLFKP